MSEIFSSPKGSVSQRLLKGTFITFIGFILLKALRFILVPLYTRYLSPEDYGILGVFLPLIELLVMIGTLGLNSSITFFLFEYRNEENKYKNLLSTVFLINLFFSTIIGIIFYFSSPLFYKFFFKNNIENSNSYILLVIFIILLYIPQQIVLSLLQAREKRLEIAIISILNFLILFALLFYQLVIKKSGAFGQILSVFYQNILLFFPFFLYLLFIIGKKFYFSFNLLKEALSYSIPLLPHSLSLWVLNLSDRLILSKYSGLAETGYYTFAYTCGLVMYAFVTGMQAVWGPVFFDVRKNNKDSANILGAQASHWSLLLGIIAGIGIFFTPEFVKIIASKKYWVATPYIIPVILGYFFLGIYTFPGLILQQMRKNAIVSLCTIFAATLNIISNLIFVPKYGAIAASWATAGAFCLLAILYYIFGMRLNPINIIWKEFILAILIPLVSMPLSLLSFKLKIIIFLFLAIISIKFGFLNLCKRAVKKFL